MVVSPELRELIVQAALMDEKYPGFFKHYLDFLTALFTLPIPKIDGRGATPVGSC